MTQTDEGILLSPCQTRILDSKARFVVLVAGRRFGKTHVGLTYLLQRICNPEARNLVVWYIAPSYRQAAQIAWRLLKGILPQGWAVKTNETDLSIELKNGCVIALRGADNPDSLRGVGLDAAVLDEFQDIGIQAWNEVIRPALADRRGGALFMGTPKGFDSGLYALWNEAHDREGWEPFQFTTAEGGRVPLEEIEAARRDMDLQSFRQEFEASFESMAGRVYQNFERGRNVRADLEDTGGDLLCGLDFNINPMSAIIGVQAGDQFHVLHEIELRNANTQIMVDAIKAKFRGRRIKVFPDPSGKARKTSAPVGETDFTLLQQAGFVVLAPNKAPAVVDRINTVNTLFLNAEGATRLFIHPRCKSLIKSLEGLTYKEGTSAPDKGLGLDHMVDALGYACWEAFPLASRAAKVYRLPF